MSNQKKFDLSGNFKNMFKATDPNNQNISKGTANVEIDRLVPFKNHPFKLYEGERLSDMVESIKANGIITPVIVRPIDEESYEILSGHNRIEAAKAAGLETVPVIIRNDLSDDEALLVVTETNLCQRSFSDLSHSERAAALAVHHGAIKNQGRRTDLINEIENLLKNTENISNDAGFETSSQCATKLPAREKTGQFEASAHIAPKLTAREKIGQKYGLSKDTVARYLRINKLPQFLKDCLDGDRIPFLAAVTLSYMAEADQYDLIDIIKDNQNLKIDIKKANLLREYSENKKLTPKHIKDILSGVAFKKKNRTALPVQSLKIGGKILSKYFKPEQKPEEIQAEIIEAVEFYRAHKNTSKK